MEHSLDVEEIRALLPHRYPFLLVDRVLELRPGERVIGLKNVTINEPFFNGHFPGQAVMPGVLILESMAQVAGVLMLSLPEHQGKLAYIAGIHNARFRKPVVPGDTLIIEANFERFRMGIGKVTMTARVEGEPVAECAMTFAFKTQDRPTPQQVLRKLHGNQTENNGGEHSAEGATDGHPIARRIADSVTDRDSQGAIDRD